MALSDVAQSESSLAVAQAKFIQAENQFIQLLEGLHPTEAKLLLNVVKKKLPYKGLTSRLVNQAFPNLLPEKDARART